MLQEGPKNRGQRQRAGDGDDGHDDDDDDDDDVYDRDDRDDGDDGDDDNDDEGMACTVFHRLGHRSPSV